LSNCNCKCKLTRGSSGCRELEYGCSSELNECRGGEFMRRECIGCDCLDPGSGECALGKIDNSGGEYCPKGFMHPIEGLKSHVDLG
jgi:hypothetical protein